MRLILALILSLFVSTGYAANFNAYPNAETVADADELMFWSTAEGGVKNVTYAVLRALVIDGVLTPATAKTAYESNANTNAFTDALLSKLNGIEAGATADLTGAEITTLLNVYLGTTDWQGGGSGGSSELDGLSDVTGAGTQGYYLMDNGNGTYIFRPAPTAISTLAELTDITNPSAADGLVLKSNGNGKFTFENDDTGAGEANVQVDWNVVDTGSDAFILNKPTTITTAQANEIAANTLKRSYPVSAEEKLAGINPGAEVNVNADWNATSGDAQILNKPTLGTAAATASTAYATAAQGALADSALQSESDPTVAGAISTHAGLADPHPGYVLESAAGAAAYLDATNGTIGDAVVWVDDGSGGASLPIDVAGSPITDTGNYFTTDTIEGALQEIGASGTGTDDQTAAEVPFTPAGTIAATNVQAAIEEVASEAGSASAINDLTDVDTTGVTTNSIIKYNGTTWVVGTDETAAGAGYVSTAPTYSDEACTAGQYAFTTTTGYVCVSSGDWNTFALTDWSNPTPDTTPNTFTFTSQTDVATATEITSDIVQITGINTAAAVTATNGTAAICTTANLVDCGTFGASPGNITNEQYVAARHTSSGTASTPTVTTVNVGTESATFTSTTAAGGAGVVVESYSTAYVDSTTPSTITISKPTGTVEGDLLILLSSSQRVLTEANNAGWGTELTEVSTDRLFAMSKVAGASEPTDYTFTYSTNYTDAHIMLVRVSGAGSVAGFGPQNIDAYGTTMTWPDIDVSSSGSVVIWFGGRATRGTATTLSSTDKGTIEYNVGSITNAYSLFVSVETGVESGLAITGASGVTSDSADGKWAAAIVVAP